MKHRTGSENVFLTGIKTHILDFWPVWVVLVLFFGVAVIFAATEHWTIARIIADSGLLILLLLLLIRPMNVVYGLIGTSGSVGYFFASVIIISLIFTCIYYWGFYHKSAVCYDVNQPHIRFEMFRDSAYTEQSVQKNAFVRDTMRDTVFLHGLALEQGMPYFINEEIHVYQKITFGDVLRNTVLTSLIQEPTDLFAATATFNIGMYHTHANSLNDQNNQARNEQVDRARAHLFHWILILQILISWILLGVFISILYNKFRYES